MSAGKRFRREMQRTKMNVLQSQYVSGRLIVGVQCNVFDEWPRVETTASLGMILGNGHNSAVLDRQA